MSRVLIVDFGYRLRVSLSSRRVVIPIPGSGCTSLAMRCVDRGLHGGATSTNFGFVSVYEDSPRLAYLRVFEDINISVSGNLASDADVRDREIVRSLLECAKWTSP